MDKKIIKDNQISKNLNHQILLSLNEDKLYLWVTMDNGRFVVAKTFPNNVLGMEKLDLAIKNLNTEEKVLFYLKLDSSRTRLKNKENLNNGQ